MNPNQIINLIPDIIKNRKTSPTDRWLLIIIDDKIECVAADGEQHEGLPLMPISMNHVNNGFGGREWDRLTNRIAAYQKDHPDFYAEPAATSDPEKTETETEKTPEPENVDPDPDTK